MVFKSKVTYAYKEGARFGVSAQVAGEVCEELEQKGELTAKNLVEVSRPATAPLHKIFEWNDAEAAEKYRESQARNLIRHITVVVETNTGNEEPTRAFVNYKDDEPTYEYVETVIKTADKYAEYKRMALRELAAFQKKYSQIKELAPVFEAIETVERAETA